jgi:hypothetical protein
LAYKFWSNCHKKYIFAKINLFSRALSWQNFYFLPLKKIMPDSGEKKDFSISKLGSQGLKRPPSKSMEVIAPAFFDLRSSRGPQRLLESAI